MKKPLASSIFSSKPTVEQGNGKHWLLLVLAANAAIWGLSFLYLKTSPLTYTSKWAMTLPGAGSKVNVDLPSVGQASSDSGSPYGDSSDPRANYQFVATSEPVLAIAADSINMSAEEFGKPRIKLVDNTTIMQFEVNGTSPVETQKKSLALFQAFTQQLSLLRAEEVAQRTEATQGGLRSAKAKLEASQKRLAEYKARSGLGSSDQLSNLSTSIEELRKQRAEVLAQQRQTTSRSKQLSNDLNLSSQQASDAFILQSDDLLKQHTKTYSETSAALTTLRSKFNSTHPEVANKKAEQEAAKAALLSRSRSLVGKPISQQALEQLSLSMSGPGAARESLFQDLITVQADQRGLTGQAQALDQQIVQLESRLKLLTQKEATLESLKRDTQLTEAVFTSTIAKLDLSQSDVFTSYPLVQLLNAPSLPKQPSSPKKFLVLLGSGLASIFTTAGLALLWRSLARRELNAIEAAIEQDWPRSDRCREPFTENGVTSDLTNRKVLNTSEQQRE